ncbi:MAG TPA: RIP metalloprotease RseP [Gemmatimonadales bacterium]|nr:RIP metalloprotease RseP [Gemmatimonadales bacterium]
MLLTIASLIVVLGVLIFVHELGHFLVAKAVGIQVLRFSLGFGRPVVEFRRGETEYWISWLPLGGYVKMAGLEDEGMAGELEGGKSSVPIDPARAFDKQPLWARMAVILAGVTMNVVLAFVIFTVLFAASGVPVRTTTQVDTVLARMLPPGAEALATLHRGDRIVRVNDDTVKTWDDFQQQLLTSGPEARLEIAGRTERLSVHLTDDRRARLRLVQWAILPYAPAQIALVYPGEPAARGGLKSGDVVVRANGDSVRSWNDVLFTLWANPGKSVALTVRRENALVNLQVTPRAEEEQDSLSPRPKTFGLIGAEGDYPTARKRLPIMTALRGGVMRTVGQLGLVLASVKRLIQGRGFRELGGPIAIAQVSGQAARLGLDRFLILLANISIGLAVLNLLPIPVLDGGQAVFLIAEAILRRPLSIQLRLRLTQVGFLVILGIMALAIVNDVIRVLPR